MIWGDQQLECFDEAIHAQTAALAVHPCNAPHPHPSLAVFRWSARRTVGATSRRVSATRALSASPLGRCEAWAAGKRARAAGSRREQGWSRLCGRLASEPHVRLARSRLTNMLLYFAPVPPACLPHLLLPCPLRISTWPPPMVARACGSTWRTGSPCPPASPMTSSLR